MSLLKRFVLVLLVYYTFVEHHSSFKPPCNLCPSHYVVCSANKLSIQLVVEDFYIQACCHERGNTIPSYFRLAFRSNVSFTETTFKNNVNIVTSLGSVTYGDTIMTSGEFFE